MEVVGVFQGGGGLDVSSESLTSILHLKAAYLDYQDPVEVVGVFKEMRIFMVLMRV